VARQSVAEHRLASRLGSLSGALLEGLKSSEQEAREIVDAIPQTIALLCPDGSPEFRRLWSRTLMKTLQWLSERWSG